MSRQSLRQFAAMLVVWFAAVALSWADENTAPFRLPADVAAPVRYAIDLTLVPDTDTFGGSSQIEIDFKKETSSLWLNADKLQIKDASLTIGQKTMPLKVVSTPKDYVRFEFPNPVGPGRGTLHVAYSGEISREDMAGIFQVKDGDQWYIYSQFENISARRAYPCFDEPGYKVPWQVTLHVKKEQSALSNTPVVSETDEGNGMKAVKFAETKPLPSYLVAYAVGNFDFVDAGTTGQKRTRVRIVTPHGRASEARYAAETTPAILDLLEKYFDIPYPYEKLDEVAIPGATFAMEHPGMVTYSDIVILSKPETETVGTKRLWVSTAAHELAHQWFGDLVTMAWWDDTWLNEGFASWMANKIANEYRPEWHMNVDELNDYQQAMETDELVSARMVRQPIESNDDIDNAFDDITYKKGSALLNMFESYMGPERFRKGVQAYLKQYSWKNATSAEFLASLAGDDPSIATAFSSFLDQAGVPLITVKLECAGQPAQIDVSQQRFLPMGSAGSGSEQWKIPLCVRYPGDSGPQRQCTLLDHKSATLAFEKAKSCPQWVEGNADADGYYRVAYQNDVLKSLLKDNAAVLTVPERVSVIGDIQALTGNGTFALGNAFALVPNLANDPSGAVVSKTLGITSDRQNVLDASVFSKYHQYIMDVYGPRAQQLGWADKPGESDDDRLLRPHLADVIARQAEDPAAQTEASRLARAWLDDHSAVSPDMVQTVLRSAAIHGDRNLFDRIRAEAHNEKDPQILYSMMFALGSFRDPEIVKTAMPIVLTDEFPSQWKIVILFGIAEAPATRDQVYDFVKQNWDALVAKMPTDTGAELPNVASYYCDEQHLQDVKAFFEGRSTKYTGGPRDLSQVLESIDLCIAYKKSQQPSLTEFLQSYGGTKPERAASGAQ